MNLNHIGIHTLMDWIYRRGLISHRPTWLQKYFLSLDTQMWNHYAFGFAGLMAFIDVLVFGWMKEYSLGNITWRGLIPIMMCVYSLEPYFFLQSLQYESMTVMNIMWDAISDVMVTIMGLFYFKEKLSTLKWTGLTFAFIGIVLMSYEELSQESFSSKG